MVHYRLVYFDGRGAGELARILFHHEGIEFEDVRVPIDQWPGEEKSKAPFGLMPYLEVDGLKLPGAFPIDRYLARKFGLAGMDAWEQATVDALADWIKDIGIEVYPFMATAFGYKDGVMNKLRTETFDPAMHKLTGKLEELLSASGSGFLVQSGYTWVDFLAAEALNAYEGAAQGLLDMYPDVKAYKERVYKIPKIKDYIENRKSDLWHKYRHT